MKNDRRWFLGIACVLVSLLASSVTAHAKDPASSRWRWDIIINDTSTTPPTISAGGTAVTLAGDSKTSLTLTGTGFLRKLPKTARFTAIAKEGGGTWETFDATGTSTGSGTYTVKRGPASFFEIPGSSLPSPGPTDNIGNNVDARGGFLLVEIKYDDGDRGVLGVACALGGGGKAYEGVIATKGATQFLTISSGATLFHVIPPGT